MFLLTALHFSPILCPRAPLLGLNSEAEGDDDLDDEKADDQADNAANPIRAERRDSLVF